MKRLRFLPHDVMERMVTEAPLPNSIPASSMPSTNRSQPQGSSTRQNLPARQPSSQRPAPPPQVHHAERTGSPNFTDADDTLLENHVRSNVESGKMWNSKFIYEELAQKVLTASPSLPPYEVIILAWLTTNSTPIIQPHPGSIDSQKCGEDTK